VFVQNPYSFRPPVASIRIFGLSERQVWPELQSLFVPTRHHLMHVPEVLHPKPGLQSASVWHDALWVSGVQLVYQSLSSP
jgi:hypothetical protein